MHIDRTHHIAVSAEPALFTVPLTIAWFMLMPTCRTPATGSSFGAGEAHDAGRFGFVGQIVDIFAVLPQGHTLIVAASTVLVANTMRIANKEGAYLLLHAEVKHLPGGFVAQVTYPALTATTRLVFRSLQCAPAFGPGFAPFLLASNLAHALEALAFEGANAPSRDHQRLARIGGDGGKMNLTEIHGGMDIAGCLFSLWCFDAHMQLKAMVPHQRTRPAVLWQVHRQDEGGAPASHRQDDASLLTAHRLCRPNASMETESLQVGKTRYTHYSIAYHLIWIPKYRRRVLTGEVQVETKRLIAECCEQQGLTLLALETDDDHIHVFVSAPPRFSPALIANHLKGYSSRFLREKFPHLKKLCGKDHLWTSTYYVGTAGAVSAETIKRYITECQGK